MASKNIKGITIEIGGNTTKLQDALKGVNKQIYSLNSDLKNLNQALKLDPNNISLLTQKMDVLKRNISDTKDKLTTLKDAQREMGVYSKLTDEQKSSYNALSKEIAVTENALKKMKKELNDTGTNGILHLDKLKEGFSKVASVAGTAVDALVKVSSVIGGAMVAAVTAGVKSYADLEVAQKGSERLFGDSFDTVKKNAADAYKSLGLSSSQYYDQVNTYAVGLKEALKGDSKAAAELSNSILIAQSDIVAATGADASAVSNAFAAVMRGNYTMLDNLRIGIKGSKEGMEEVVNKVNAWNKAQGNATKYQMGNYADMQKALVDYVKMVGVAGTAEKQMSETIKGSFGQMKAALDNFLNGSGSIEAFSKTLTNFLGNIVNSVKNLAPSILTGVTEMLTTLIPQLGELLMSILPDLFTAVQNFLDAIFTMLSSDPSSVISFVTNLLNQIVTFITTNLATFIDVGFKLIISIAEGLVNNIPLIINSILTLIKSLVDTLTNPENLSRFIAASLDIIMALIDGLVEALPELINMIPTIIENIVNTLLRPDMIQKIITTGIKLIITLGGALIQAIPQLLSMLPQIIMSINKSFIDLITKTNWGELGSNIVKGICDGFAKVGDYIKRKVTAVKDEVEKKFKSLFGIKSPSRLMRDQVGIQITRGIGVGIEKGIPEVISDVQNAMVDLNNGIQASVNPIINPTANNNPLYINVDKFYNNREQDIQALAEELEYYRRKSSIATGGN